MNYPPVNFGSWAEALQAGLKKDTGQYPAPLPMRVVEPPTVLTIPKPIMTCPVALQTLGVVIMTPQMITDIAGAVHGDNFEWAILLYGKRELGGRKVVVERIEIVKDQVRGKGEVDKINVVSTPDLLGPLHSHHSMGAFMSGTDVNELNPFFSLSIVVSTRENNSPVLGGGDLWETYDEEMQLFDFAYRAYGKVSLHPDTCGLRGEVLFRISTDPNDEPSLRYGTLDIAKQNAFDMEGEDIESEFEFGDMKCPTKRIERMNTVENTYKFEMTPCGINSLPVIVVEPLGRTNGILTNLPPVKQIPTHVSTFRVEPLKSQQFNSKQPNPVHTLRSAPPVVEGSKELQMLSKLLVNRYKTSHKNYKFISPENLHTLSQHLHRDLSSDNLYDWMCGTLTLNLLLAFIDDPYTGSAYESIKFHSNVSSVGAGVEGIYELLIENIVETIESYISAHNANVPTYREFPLQAPEQTAENFLLMPSTLEAWGKLVEDWKELLVEPKDDTESSTDTDLVDATAAADADDTIRALREWASDDWWLR